MTQLPNSTSINNLISQTAGLQCTDYTENPSDSLNEEHTIIAQILTSKTINMNAFRSTMVKAWNPKGKFLTNQLQQNSMAFIFESQNDFQKITNLSWCFRESQVIINHWPPDKALHEIDMTKNTFWIQATNLPACLINNQTASFIGNIVGEFIKTDNLTSSHKWKRSLRIKVHVDITKPLQDHVDIPRQGTTNLLTEIRYERLAEFCFFCGMLGHKVFNCIFSTDYVPIEISNCKYGPWLKTENIHIQNPLFLKTSQKTISQNPSQFGKPTHPGNHQNRKNAPEFSSGEKAVQTIKTDMTHLPQKEMSEIKCPQSLLIAHSENPTFEAVQNFSFPDKRKMALMRQEIPFSIADNSDSVVLTIETYSQKLSINEARNPNLLPRITPHIGPSQKF